MAKIEILSVNSFELAWRDKGSGADMDGAFYNPMNIPIGFNAIGSYGQGNYSTPTGSILVVKEIESGTLAYPVDFKLIYNDKGSGADMDGSFWEPIPPKGYVAMGILCVHGYNEPAKSSVVCLRSDLVVPATVGRLIWDDKGSGADMDGGFWDISTVGSIQTGAFAGASNYHSSNAAPLFGINHSVI